MRYLDAHVSINERGDMESAIGRPPERRRRRWRKERRLRVVVVVVVVVVMVGAVVVIASAHTEWPLWCRGQPTGRKEAAGGSEGKANMSE